MQADCDVHGLKAFEFEILELVDSTDPQVLAERELHWVRHHQSNDPNCGYYLDEIGSDPQLQTLSVRLPGETLKRLTSTFPLQVDRDQFFLEVLQQTLKFR
ncbi:hypothetical protein [Deinococcus cellulosilyticus]|uniref:hypothetical protein n=1 Tax=Deinococcus cellulosilyticus TaxID=401558 RepID=UPI0011BEB82D|nr:hypothetical protein [Deinococcus cellulosilyticus]